MNNRPINDEELSASASANVSCFRCMNPTGLQDEDLANCTEGQGRCAACACRIPEVQDEELTALSAYPCTTCSNLCSRNNPAAFHDEELTAWSATPYAARICTFVVEKDEDLSMNAEAQRQCFYCRPSPAELQDEDLAMNATQMHCGACFCTHTQVKVQDEDLSIKLEVQRQCIRQCICNHRSPAEVQDEDLAIKAEAPVCIVCRLSPAEMQDEELASAPELQLRQCYRCASPSSADLPTD
ncbi:MAG: hypothetical protein H6R18_219 [Proteobacteria bacterium]|nr:hypothetical protein [Pseudomonadota bacterium]